LKTVVINEQKPFFDKGQPATFQREGYNLCFTLLSLWNTRRLKNPLDIILFDRFFYNAIPFIETETQQAQSKLKREMERRNPFLYRTIANEASRLIQLLVLVTPIPDSISMFAAEGKTRNLEYLQLLATSFNALPQIIIDARKKINRQLSPLVVGKITLDSPTTNYVPDLLDMVNKTHTFFKPIP
jgi:hypothetical protein